MSQSTRRLGLETNSEVYLRAQRLLNDFRTPLARKSFSQFGEDLAIASLLDHANGKYLDVGAGRAKRGSNSYFFYKLGWSGVAVDPLASNHQEFKRYRPRDQFIQGLCGSSTDNVNFYEFSPYEYSTTREDVAKGLKEDGFIFRQASLLPQIRIMDLDFQANPGDNLFLTVDVEGAELEVLRGIDWRTFLPRVICIEMWASKRKAKGSLPEVLMDLGYRLVAVLGPSLIFLHQDFREHQLSLGVSMYD